MKERLSRLMFGSSHKLKGARCWRNQPSSSYDGFRSRKTETVFFWFMVLILFAEIMLIFIQASAAQADGAALPLLVAYDRQAVHLGETTLIAQKFWWEDRLDPTTGKYQAVLTAELHLVRADMNERVRVESGSKFSVGQNLLEVLEVNSSITHGSYVVLQHSSVQ